MDDLALFLGYGVIYCIDAFGLLALIAIPIIMISKSRTEKAPKPEGEYRIEYISADEIRLTPLAQKPKK